MESMLIAVGHPWKPYLCKVCGIFGHMVKENILKVSSRFGSLSEGGGARKEEWKLLKSINGKEEAKTIDIDLCRW